MTALAEKLTIGQHWRRRRDGYQARIRQVHRVDRVVEVEPIWLDLFPGKAPRTVRFDELAEKWELVR